MSVYVDQVASPFGRMLMYHMIADTPAELRAMALQLGLKLSWFQQLSSMPHFDIAKGKKEVAVKLGAIELDRRAYVDAMRRIRPSWPKAKAGHWLLTDGRAISPSREG